MVEWATLRIFSAVLFAEKNTFSKNVSTRERRGVGDQRLPYRAARLSQGVREHCRGCVPGGGAEGGWEKNNIKAKHSNKNGENPH